MKKTAQEAVEDIINSVLKPILKERGYHKRGKNWNFREGELIKVVNVQSSMGNDSEKAKFTVNLGIYNPEFQKENIAASKAKDKNIREYDCEIRQRLGTLSLGHDFWWTVFAGNNNEKVSEDLKEKFIGYGLKWLESFRSLDDEYSYFLNTQNYGSALVAAYLLKKNSASEHFYQAIEKANPYYAAMLERWKNERKLKF